MKVEWADGSHWRRITLTHADLPYFDPLTFNIPLRKRPRPWTFSAAGSTSTRSGYLHPNYWFEHQGFKFFVVMGHEKKDFPSETDLVNNLGWGFYTSPSLVALSPEGILVAVQESKGKDEIHLGLHIYYLRIKGKVPSEELLRPFLKGEVTTFGFDPKGIMADW